MFGRFLHLGVTSKISESVECDGGSSLQIQGSDLMIILTFREARVASSMFVLPVMPHVNLSSVACQ